MEPLGVMLWAVAVLVVAVVLAIVAMLIIAVVQAIRKPRSGGMTNVIGKERR